MDDYEIGAVVLVLAGAAAVWCALLPLLWLLGVIDG